MDREKYKNALGFVVNYKGPDEPLLFNELHGRCGRLELLERGDDSAAFASGQYEEIAEQLHREDFVFLHHIHPFMCRREIKGDSRDFPEYEKMLEETAVFIGRGDAVACQCRIAAKKSLDYGNGELTKLLVSWLEREKYMVSAREADTAVSLTVFDRFAYMGVSRMEDNASRWTGGVLFFSRTEDIICRAEFKIEEAFQIFGIQVQEGMKALDLGAAPGGWTHYLSKRGIRVDAVDPAELDGTVVRSEKVRHYKMTAQEFARTWGGEKYDILVNDMKMDTNQSIDIVCGMLDCLKEDGICLMTLKLPRQGIQKRIHVAGKVLGERFVSVRIRQLYYNRSEVTVFARGKKNRETNPHQL